MKVLTNFSIATLMMGSVFAGWRFTYKGYKIDCAAGEIMDGMCGSGWRPRCKDYIGKEHYYGIHCSKIGTNDFPLEECTRRWSWYGDYASCPSSRPLARGGCGSGSSGRCNEKTEFNGINCCKKNDVKMDTKRCKRVSGTYGELTRCPLGYAVHSLCGSGRYRDCYGKLIKLYCCKIEDVKIDKIVYHTDRATITAEKPIIEAGRTVTNTCLPGVEVCPVQEDRIVSMLSLTESQTLTKTKGRDVTKGAKLDIKPAFGIFKKLGLSFGLSGSFANKRSISWGSTESVTRSTSHWGTCKAGPNSVTRCEMWVSKGLINIPFTITWTNGAVTEGTYNGVQYFTGRTNIVTKPYTYIEDSTSIIKPTTGPLGICVNVKVSNLDKYATSKGNSIDVFLKLEGSDTEYKFTVEGFNNLGSTYKACGYENITVPSLTVEKVSVEGSRLNDDGIMVAGGDDGFIVEINGLKSSFILECSNNAKGWWIDTDNSDSPCGTGQRCELYKF